MKYISKEVEIFMDELKNSNIKKQDYEYQKYKCELADLFEAQMQKDIEGCLKFFVNQEHNKYFEIKHPLYNDIIIRAVFSTETHPEIIFLIDENNKYPVLLISDKCAVDFIITSGNIFFMPYGTRPISNERIFNEIKGQDLSFKDISWGFLLKMVPWHYFYESLVYFMALNTEKNIKDVHDIFFIPKKYKNKRTKNEVYIPPRALPGHLFLSHDSTRQYFIDMGKSIYKESIQDFSHYVKQDNKAYDLTIWLGLTSSNFGRRWIEQIEGTAEIIKELLKYFSNIKIYFDGLTTYDTQKELDAVSLGSQIEKDLKSNIQAICDFSKITFISLDKHNYRDKICHCSTIDMAIVEGASAAMIPSLFCQKPCVFFGNYEYIRHPILTNPIKISKIISQQFMQENHMKPPVDGWNGSYPYHISWQHIFNLSAEILKELRNIDIQRLDVSPVNLISLIYELKDENQILKQDILSLNTLKEELKKPQGATLRVKSHLAYQLGFAIIENSHSFKKWLQIPFILGYIIDKYKIEQQSYKKTVEQNPNLRLPTLESYKDYQESLKIKETLPYQIGLTLINLSHSKFKMFIYIISNLWKSKNTKKG